MAAPVYVNATRVNNPTGGTGGTMVAPANLQSGDFLVYGAFASIDLPGTNVFEPPTGGSGAAWTRIAPTATGAVQVFYRVAQATDVGATFTAAWTTNGNAGGAIMSAYRGAVAVGDISRTAFGASPNAIVSATDPRIISMASLPNVGAERLAVWFTALASGSSSGPTNRRYQGPSAGLNMRICTSLGNPLNTTGASNIADLSLADYQAPSAQSTPALTVESASPGGNGGWGERSSAQLGLVLVALSTYVPAIML